MRHTESTDRGSEEARPARTPRGRRAREVTTRLAPGGAAQPGRNRRDVRRTNRQGKAGGKQAGRAPGPSPRDSGARAARVHGRGQRTGWAATSCTLGEAGGAKEAAAQWAVRRSRKRPERVMRNEQSDRSKGALRRLSMRVMPDQAPSPAEPARHSAPGGPSPGRSLWAGGVTEQFSAQRSPAAPTGTKLSGHREAERAKAGRRSCSLWGWAGQTDKRCRRGQAAAVPAPSPAEPARHRAPGGQTAGRSSAGVKFSAKRSPATLTGTIFPGHSEATRAKAGRPYPSYSSSRSKITRITCSGFPITLSMMISAALILSRAGVR